MNMIQQHIDDDTLSQFVKEASHSDAASTDHNSMDSVLYNKVSDHVALCEDCRNQAAIISTLHEKWPDIRQQTQLTEDQQLSICDYLDGHLSAEEADTVRTLIETHPDAMKAALHYQSHSESMQHSLARGAVTSENNVSASHAQVSVLTHLMTAARELFSIRSPMVYTMTATAGLFIAVLLLVQSPVMQKQQLMVASYQDNPTIKFTETNKLPGVGFFSQSGSTSKPFKDITIELVTENSIKITWPKIDGAELYKMRIQVFNQGKKTVLKENTSQTNHTIFYFETANEKKTNASLNKRYEWVLYGNTRDDRMFYASGGFVISMADTENSDFDTWW